MQIVIINLYSTTLKEVPQWHPKLTTPKHERNVFQMPAKTGRETKKLSYNKKQRKYLCICTNFVCPSRTKLTNCLTQPCQIYLGCSINFYQSSKHIFNFLQQPFFTLHQGKTQQKMIIRRFRNNDTRSANSKAIGLVHMKSANF